MNRNLSVVATRDFCNKAFIEGLPLRILISDRCKNFITDLEFMKEAPDGGKLKEHATDPQTRQRYEKYGHTSDTFRYFLVSAFNGLFENK